ncbi:MAG: hypothetical protein OQL05_04480 [Gammaproteobacteria bacterium]|nr:hypothetical protein [Gammaproteobacteria bacterium]MCW8972518.1 hypothetical protein [Gammaproteobacteria bacterium]MCW8993130.1 hypothetical protein [Gammaproteobacteria bacterium]
MMTDETPQAGDNGFQKLIRCRMVNREGQSSIRYVTLEYFLLWEYMMQHRHGFSFEEYSLGMWVPEEEFEHKPDLYSHSGEVERVNRFNIAIYDENYHYTYCVARYVRDSESDAFNEVVLSHVPADVRNSDRFSMEQIGGYCIVRDKAPDRERFVLGLYGGLHDLY